MHMPFVTTPVFMYCLHVHVLSKLLVLENIENQMKEAVVEIGDVTRSCHASFSITSLMLHLQKNSVSFINV